jgi:hypothetical protein
VEKVRVPTGTPANLTEVIRGFPQSFQHLAGNASIYTTTTPYRSINFASIGLE